MKTLIRQSDIPVILLSLYAVKSFIYSPTLFDSVVILGLSVLFGCKLYLDHIKKEDFSIDMINRIAKVKEDNTRLIGNLELVNKDALDRVDAKLSTLALNAATISGKKSSEFKWR